MGIDECDEDRRHAWGMVTHSQCLLRWDRPDGPASGFVERWFENAENINKLWDPEYNGQTNHYFNEHFIAQQPCRAVAEFNQYQRQLSTLMWTRAQNGVPYNEFQRYLIMIGIQGIHCI